MTPSLFKSKNAACFCRTFSPSGMGFSPAPPATPANICSLTVIKLVE